ncbi:MAG: SapC family protein [Halomonas sp.]|uniref:SapC family protein n=1 Tax=Halomonas sp. TaxID=1486246 RepID=UPI003F934214
MSDWQPVSRRRHADFAWRPRQSFYFAATLRYLPVVLAELPKLLGDYVLAFVGEEDAPELVAITDIGLGNNLYVDRQGRWLSRYVPAALRAYPFDMIRNESGEPVLGVCCDQLVERGGGAQPLFDAEGEPSSDVTGVANFLQQRERQRDLTHQACRLMTELGLLVPWPLKVRLEKDAEPEVMPGLWRVESKALAGLKGEALERLNTLGALPLVTLQPMTAEHLPRLLERGRFTAQQAPAEAPLPENLDDFFSEDEELYLDFGDE